MYFCTLLIDMPLNFLQLLTDCIISDFTSVINKRRNILFTISLSQNRELMAAIGHI